jgi:hypothetical protein
VADVVLPVVFSTLVVVVFVALSELVIVNTSVEVVTVVETGSVVVAAGAVTVGVVAAGVSVLPPQAIRAVNSNVIIICFPYSVTVSAVSAVSLVSAVSAVSAVSEVSAVSTGAEVSAPAVSSLSPPHPIRSANSKLIIIFLR